MSEVWHIYVLNFLFSIGLLGFVYGCMYKRTRLDGLREDLFTIRDELFDYMWQHNLPYELPAYQLTRAGLNGLIRFANQLHLLPILVFLYVTRDRDTDDRLSEAIEDMEDVEARKHFKAVRQKIGDRLLTYFFLEGPQWVLIQGLVFVSQCVGGAWRVSKWAYAWTDRLTERWSEWGIKDSPEAQVFRKHLPVSAAR